MGNELQVIDQREVLGKDFKIYGDFDNPLFAAKEVAVWIDYAKTGEGYYDVSAMLRTVDEPEKTTIKNRSYLTEDGLYEVLMQSRKPIAKSFKREVKDILRSIRKHGVYATPQTLEAMISDPDTTIRILTALKEERNKNNALLIENDKQKQIIGELQPKADYVDYILSSTGTMTSGQIAADYGMTANRLNKILKEERIHRFVNDQWILYAEHMNMGYTKSETIPITRSDGRPDTKMFTKWTQKGRLMINDVLNRRGIYANMDLIKSA